MLVSASKMNKMLYDQKQMANPEPGFCRTAVRIIPWENAD